MYHKLKRVYEYGLWHSVLIVYYRLKKRWFSWYWRLRLSVPLTYYSCKDGKQPTQLLPIDVIYCTNCVPANCIQKAQQAIDNRYTVLGSNLAYYKDIPWHVDIRLQQEQQNADVYFDKDRFFTDITITCGKKICIKDIKVPWELSRCHMVSIVGHAYQLTNDEQYASTALTIIDAWITDNPFLHGVNWMCPMEVGIRIINWVVALSLIQKSIVFEKYDCTSIIQSVREHQWFIEGNFEWYDGKTSNHYLSDLVGYLYCAYFLNERKKIRWCLRELLQELEKQILPDGTSYEGSTAYHCLVYELLHKAWQIATIVEELLYVQQLQVILERMSFFILCCTPKDGTLITIGDNDSGKITPFKSTLLAPTEKKSYKKHHFQFFGLSTYKTKRLHATLRHYSYNKKQPTGHFHNDAGSITVTVDGIPLFVDPGSYLYTPSIYWRNRFRSVAAHSTSYLVDIEPTSITDSLFYLALQECTQKSQLFVEEHMLYKEYGAQFKRELQCDSAKICIRDTWQIEKCRPNQLCWQFVLGPLVQARIENEVVCFFYKDTCIASMTTPGLSFEVIDNFFSPSYGKKVSTTCIRAYRSYATLSTEMRLTI